MSSRDTAHVPAILETWHARPPPAASHVGSLIAEQRQRRGLTVDDLASKTKIDSSNIRTYEAGRSLVGLHSLVRIAAALKVQPGSLLKGLELTMFEKES